MLTRFSWLYGVQAGLSSVPEAMVYQGIHRQLERKSLAPRHQHLTSKAALLQTLSTVLQGGQGSTANFGPCRTTEDDG
jgi:hypothetical protein